MSTRSQIVNDGLAQGAVALYARIFVAVFLVVWAMVNLWWATAVVLALSSTVLIVYCANQFGGAQKQISHNSNSD